MKEAQKKRKAIYHKHWRMRPGVRARLLVYCRQWNAAQKLKVFTHYGLRCSCGFSDLRALTIDHINGGGRKHVRKIKSGEGIGFYRWLIKHHFPKGFQTLCANCQMIKERNGDHHPR